MVEGALDDGWPAALDLGVAGVALEGEERSGDLAVFAPYARGGLAVVIDGLGHGDEAADASAIAAKVIRAHADDAPAALLARCHEALRRSRGVVMTAAWFDLERPGALLGGRRQRRGAAGARRAGLRRPPRLGARARRRRRLQPAARPAHAHRPAPGDAVAFATDGIDADYSASLTPGLPAQRLAERILERHARGHRRRPRGRRPLRGTLTRRASTRQFARATACKVILPGIRPRRTNVPTQRPSTIRLRTCLFQEAAEIVDQEYGSDLSLDDIARRVASSRRQLQRAYAEIGQTTFRDHLTRVRMEKAAELLATRGLTVREVAHRVGYRQPAQFAKAFRRHQGVAPSDFRAERARARTAASRAPFDARRRPRRLAAAPARSAPGVPSVAALP